MINAANGRPSVQVPVPMLAALLKGGGSIAEAIAERRIDDRLLAELDEFTSGRQPVLALMPGQSAAIIELIRVYKIATGAKA